MKKHIILAVMLIAFSCAQANAQESITKELPQRTESLELNGIQAAPGSFQFIFEESAQPIKVDAGLLKQIEASRDSRKTVYLLYSATTVIKVFPLQTAPEAPTQQAPLVLNSQEFKALIKK